MTTFRFSIRPLVVGALAVLLGLFLALGTAPAAHAQLPDLDDPDIDDPDLDDPNGDLDLDLLGDLLGDDLLGDLLGDDLLDLGGLLDLGLLDDLSLDELLALLDLLGTDPDADPAPAPTPAPVPETPQVTTPTPAPAAPQVTQQPVGGVAAGAGGASEQGAPWPLLALGALTLAGAGAAVRARSVTA